MTSSHLNFTILAGSGKTHTMMGEIDRSDPDKYDLLKGIIPRALERMGQEKLVKEKEGWSFTMTVWQLLLVLLLSCPFHLSMFPESRLFTQATYVQVYNGGIRCLLKPKGSDNAVKLHATAEREERLHGAAVKPCDPTNEDQVFAILDEADSNRIVVKTAMNPASSRSHSIFSLYIEVKKPGKKTLLGQLNLVDLAGSERPEKSGVTGDALTEAIEINKSLSHLGNTFVQIGQKQKPNFRCTPLVQVLEKSFSDGGKTLLFVNLSPMASDAPESIGTMRFGENVAKCVIAKKKDKKKDQKKDLKRGEGFNEGSPKKGGGK